MSAANTAKPSRPCTEYNIFFQLERARILQEDLQSDPALDGMEPFRPTQPSYAGLPPLPSQYASLALPYDWFLPGKEQRRKRKHRKSHGVIGFHDLSNRVSAAWRDADADVRSYCAQVCAAGMVRYKRAVQEWKAHGGEVDSSSGSSSTAPAARPRSPRQAAKARRGRPSKKAAAPAPQPQEAVSAHDANVYEATNLEALEDAACASLQHLRGGTHHIEYDEEVLCLPLPPLPQVITVEQPVPAADAQFHQVPAPTQMPQDVITVEQMNDVFAREIVMLGEPLCFEPDLALSADACLSTDAPRSPSVVSCEPVPSMEVPSGSLAKEDDNPHVRRMRHLLEAELAQRGAPEGPAGGKHAVAAWAA